MLTGRKDSFGKHQDSDADVSSPHDLGNNIDMLIDMKDTTSRTFGSAFATFGAQKGLEDM